MTKRILLFFLIFLLALSGCSGQGEESSADASSELEAPQGPPGQPEGEAEPTEEESKEEVPLRQLEMTVEQAQTLLKIEGQELWSISTPEELYAFAVLVNNLDTDAMAAQVELTADLVLSGIGFVPIGDNGVGFIGSFNGNGHVITGLTIQSDKDSVGLFGTLGMGAKVSDLHLIGGQISGGNEVGGIVGSCTGTISRCSFRGTVEAAGQSAGGIAGILKGDMPAEQNSGVLILAGEIDQCAANAEVSGHAHIGGLAGDVSGAATITDSYALGSVTSIKGLGSETPNAIGGLCGALSGTVERCYASTEVYTKENSRIVGGFIGLIDGGYLSGCYFNKKPVENWKDIGYIMPEELVSTPAPSTPAVPESSAPAASEGDGEGEESEGEGGEVAPAETAPQRPPVEFDSEAGTHSGVTACTVEEITEQSTFVGWDFSQTWEITEGQNRGLPYLRAISG